jgi:predicted ester cyclase
MSVSGAESKQLVGRYLQALNGQAKPAEVVERFVSDPALVEHIRLVEEGFPFYEVIAEELIAERDLVAVRATFHGVHDGPFAGIEPTGRAVTSGFMIIYRVEGDRIAQHWLQFDVPGLIAQLTAPAVMPASV